MSDLPGRPESYWLSSTPDTDHAPLQPGSKVDVVVIGGGIAGLTAARQLLDAGRSVLVIEADRIVQGVTGYTTAKVTASHNLMYADLVERHGRDGALLYADANSTAVEHIAATVAELQADCDFTRVDNVVYSEDPAERERLEAEVAAMQDLGLPTSLRTAVDLPFPVDAAVVTSDQAQFHPRRYLLAVAADIVARGGRIAERTRALDVEEGRPLKVTTDKGVVEADDVVVATHYPILDRGLYFARLSNLRDYVVAARVPAASAPSAMYISTESPTHSIRTAPLGDAAPDEVLLIVGGEGHKPGQDDDTEERYLALASWVRERFGVERFDYRWSTQDTSTLDRVPYVGALRRGARGLWVATGFNAWGMTNGTAAGLLLADLIGGLDNPWSELFDPHRLDGPRTLLTAVKENLNVGKHLIAGHLAGARRRVEDLAPGEGDIVRLGSRRAAAYRDEAGAVHAVSPFCTHLGCVVAFNTAEKSWDCPCHGSRFDTEGKVLQGPAVRDLQPRSAT